MAQPFSGNSAAIRRLEKPCRSDHEWTLEDHLKCRYGALAHPFNQHHRVRSPASLHLPAIVAEYAGSTDGLIAGPFVKTLPLAVLIQTAGHTAVRARHKIKSICKLVIFGHAANILRVCGTYKNTSFLP